MNHQIHPNKIRQGLLLFVLAFLGIVISKELFFMLGAFLGAVTIYVLIRNTMIKLVVHYKWKRSIAAILLMFISFVLLVIPFAWLASLLVEKISPFVQEPTLVTSTFKQINTYLLEKVHLDIFNEKNISAIETKALSIVQSTLGGTISVFGSIFFMYFILYFLLTQTNEVELWLRKNVPFKNSNVHIVIKEIKESIYANAIGIPIVAIGQGILLMIGFAIFGVEEFILMGILSAVCSVIPFVGAMIVYVPIALYELSIGHTYQGIGIALWGIILVGTIDNVIRLYLQKKMNDVHPIITIFGVVIGLPLFGFLGVIFGPLLLSIFLVLVKIYIDEFGKAGIKDI